MKQVFLDTNAYSFFIKNDGRIVKAITQAEEVFLSVISVGELHAGFRRGVRFDENMIELRKFFRDERVHACKINVVTAKLYGDITYHLNRRGTPIPTNDIWIAAAVVESGATLVTYDEHFLKIPGLKAWKELKD